VQALKTQINLARIAPAQLVVFIEKQAEECVTPFPSEQRNWSQKGHVPCVCTCGERSKHFIEDDEPCVSCYELKFLELWLNQKGLALVVCALAVKGQSIFMRTRTLRSNTRCGTCPPSKQNKTRFTCQLPTMGSTCLH